MCQISKETNSDKEVVKDVFIIEHDPDVIPSTNPFGFVPLCFLHKEYM